MQEGVFTLRDLKRNKHLAGTLFNILFNLNKFVAFETRDPFTIRQAWPSCAGPHPCLSEHPPAAPWRSEGLLGPPRPPPVGEEAGWMCPYPEACSMCSPGADGWAHALHS